MSDRPRLVVLRALGLGDLLTGLPALRGLRRRFRDHWVQLAAPPALAPLAELSGAVDEVVATYQLAALDRSLHGAGVAVNLHGRGPESSRLLAAAGAGTTVAFHHRDLPWTRAFPRWQPGEHEVDRWCRLVEATGAEPDRHELSLTVPGRPAVEPAVALHPGASASARRWPPERWAAVLATIVDAGHRAVLTGSRNEVDLVDRIVMMAGLGGQPRCQVVAGRTGLVDLVSLVGHARLLVSGDTGVGHLATATATPSVLLFGPTDPAEWGPITDGPHRVLWAARRGDPNASSPDAGLLELTASDVIAAVLEELNAPGSAGGHEAAEPAHRPAQQA